MRTVVLRWAPLAVLVTIALGLTLLLAPVDRELVLRIYLLVVGGLALATAAAATAFAARRRPSTFAAALRAPRASTTARPEELERLERQVALAVENAADFHFRLRPSLVAATDAAVWRRHGVGLEEAKPLVAASLWDVVRPDRPPPPDRRAPGPPLERIAALLDEIERIER